MSVAHHFTALGAKLSRVLSTDSSSHSPPSLQTAVDSDRASTVSAQSTLQSERSVSRGREFHSSGRGGAGNIRPSPASRDPPPPVDGPDDFSFTRGREPRPVVSTGRGGAGNIRSGSRELPGINETPPALDADYENLLIREYDTKRPLGSYPSGRGGAGNIQRSDSQSTSRSRSRGPIAALRPSGEYPLDHKVAGDTIPEDAGEKKQ
ncbi:hypothetical protein OF83DRAFT_1168523 [Amylostereum chailletii]|nr:hypothetical protein OF83DRAFT_1168523 [Amylostereum chailletii]